ncbi:MAG TPA: adenylosuccinate synthetase [Candidatus Saccharimonadales bacterium]|nr:adenylosuccinate synthetase [Candidatus Saccharimonadales bacterium]
MSVEVVLGFQRGDEGKGRFIDDKAQDCDLVLRFNGGANAGHTIVLPDGQDLALHQIPSGIAYDHVVNVMGNGQFIDPVKLCTEIGDVRSKGLEVNPDRLKISQQANMVMPHHVYEDMIRESGDGAQGSTKSGIAQVASSRAQRIGHRMEDIIENPRSLRDTVLSSLKAQRPFRDNLIDPIDEEAKTEEFMQCAQLLGEYVTDTVLYTNRRLLDVRHPARALAEGAQAFLLDIDHGMWPYTTSSTTTVGGAIKGLGIPAEEISKVTGIVKSIHSHVGDGPFVTEIHDQDLLERLHGDMDSVDAEKGKTTGRIRRLGYLDFPQIGRACMVNRPDNICLSKLDWVTRFGDSFLVCVNYELEGQLLDIAPAAACQLERCRPIYVELPTWTESIEDVRDFDDLPENARNFIHFFENMINQMGILRNAVKIANIGVGPGRDQVIRR